MRREDYLEGQGKPLPSPLREGLEVQLATDLGHVRIHDDETANRSSCSLSARAFTFGNHVAFARGAFRPDTVEGNRLLTHELVHTLQQRGADPSRGVSDPADAAEQEAETIAGQAIHGQGRTPSALSNAAIQRVPAPPGSAAFDRARVTIGDVPDMPLVKIGMDWVPPPSIATIAISDPTVVHLSWELYDPTDALIQGFSTLPGRPNALDAPFSFHPGTFTSVAEGRHVLRCVGLDKQHVPVVYAERSFYVWTTFTNASQRDLPAINAVKAAPGSHGLGDVGAAYARGMMLEHQAAVAATGTGNIQGNLCPNPTPGVAKSDCTIYVLDVLRQAFAAKGRLSDWTKVMNTANVASGGALKGTEVLKALQSVAGWKGVFWSPDPRNPADRSPEHPTAYKAVNVSGTYYGIGADKAKSIIDYRPTSQTKRESMSRLDQLKRVPLGVIAARGGTHMTLILNGVVYEVHWDRPATDPNVIEATQLERWMWQSGIIVMPAEDFNLAFAGGS